jgi:hypothetical protein
MFIFKETSSQEEHETILRRLMNYILTFSSGCDFKLICLTPPGEKCAKNEHEEKIREYWFTPTTQDNFTESHRLL